MFGSQGILNKQLNAISKEKPNFWTMKQEKGTLIQYSTVNSQIRLITGSWSSLVNEKPSITILFLAKPAPGIFDWFYCLGHGISKRHGSSLDPRAMRPFSLRQHLSLKGLYTAFCVFVEASTTRVQAAVCWTPWCHHPRSAHRCHQHPRTPGISGDGVLTLQQLYILERQQETAFILRRAMPSWECIESSTRTKYVTTRAPGKLQPKTTKALVPIPLKANYGWNLHLFPFYL